MVEAEAAGVMFTANPANGRRDEVVITAAWGLGEAVVSGRWTPTTGRRQGGRADPLAAASRTRRSMTVYAADGTEERPVPAERRRRPVLDDAAAAELARLGQRIEDHFGAPQDIEWARAGGRLLACVQSRPITALPEPEADPPTDWPVPDPTALYFRASIVEQLPDPLSPLFADLVDGSVTRSLQALFGELLGRGRDPRRRRRPADHQRLRLLPLQPRRHAPADAAQPARRSRSCHRRAGGAQGRWRDYAHSALPRGASSRWTDRPLD